MPQTMLNRVLDPIADEMAQKNSISEICQFISTHQESSWLKAVWDYGCRIGAPMFDFDYKSTEDKVGDFFSIIVWNPINICRAPEDDKRGNYPADKIDLEVINWISDKELIDPQLEPVPGGWFSTLYKLARSAEENSNNISNDLIKDYINQCCMTLSNQIGYLLGYYIFTWTPREPTHHRQPINKNPILAPDKVALDEK